ncbi:MAG: hypothetical protein AA908_03445 [Chlorobi bacterium NICIL-2]|jgi:hypothetical protein|nr:MAG: hypothetical protein AA908_03445 [Chlorobi bacterium NICIL-2]GBD06208.1 hypothetical protein HRbin20_01811 [bacterium HR20]
MQPRAIIVAVIVSFGVGCTNPFAPRLLDQPITGGGLSDQRTPDGVFQNFRIAYQTKDTLTYGKLLAPSFTFLYRNYDRGVDLSWGRDEEMIATSGLFQAAQSLDLVWSDVAVSAGDSLTYDIARGFVLTITFSPTDIVRVQGRVNLRLVRVRSDDPWQIAVWRDESNY